MLEAAPWFTSLMSAGRWADYARWNEAIRSAFFDGQLASRPVYLEMSDERVDRLEAELSAAGPCASLPDAVARTFGDPREPGHRVFAGHIFKTKMWRLKGAEDTPPCLGLLGLFSLAAAHMAHDGSMAAHNYYGRLRQLLGLEDLEKRHRSIVEKEFREHSPLFWDALGLWLRRNDGALGLPTAEAFDRRRFIGLPMSQALVREADREKLTSMFSRFGLRPGQEVSRDDMELILLEWIESSGASEALKTLCKKKEAARRIAEIARGELAGWDGSGEHSQSDSEGGSRTSRREGRLSLGFRLGIFPTRAVPTLLVPPTSPTGRFRLSASISFQRDSEVGETESGAVEVDLPADLSIEALLVGKQLAVHEDGRYVLSRGPSRVVAFEQDPLLGLFSETESVSLGADLFILAHGSIAETVEGILGKSARPGWQSYESTEMRGVPPGWKAFARVQLFEIPKLVGPGANDLKALAPISGTTISFGSGLALYGRRRWHYRFPPELRIVRSKLEPSVLALQRLHEEDQARECLGSFSGTFAFDLTSLDLAPGDYRILVEDDSGGRAFKEVVTSSSFALRSGSSPRRGAMGGGPGLWHQVTSESAWWALSASAPGEVDKQGKIFIRGLQTSGLGASSPPLELNLEDAHLASVTDDQSFLESEISTAGGGDHVPPECLLTGVHIWRLPYFDPRCHKGRKIFPATCTECSMTRVFQKRGSATQTKQSIEVVISQTRPSLDLSHLADVAEGPEPTPDDLLDALSWQRFGSYRSFKALAFQASSSPWFAKELLQALSALGHLEYELDRDYQPVRWEICPTTLSFDPAGARLLLSGARSESTVSALCSAAKSHSLKVDATPQAEAPSRIAVCDVGPDAARSFHDSFQSELNGEVLLVEVPDRSLASSLPTVETLRCSLPRRVLGSAGPWKEYDVTSNQWCTTDMLTPRKAYASEGLVRRFLFIEEDALADGFAHTGDYRIVKYMAAAATGVPVLSYRSGCLVARLGSPLPGLFERAAVSSSGLLPEKSSGYLVYRDVRLEVAAELISKLTMKGRGA